MLGWEKAQEVTVGQGGKAHRGCVEPEFPMEAENWHVLNVGSRRGTGWEIKTAQEARQVAVSEGPQQGRTSTVTGSWGHSETWLEAGLPLAGAESLAGRHCLSRIPGF